MAVVAKFMANDVVDDEFVVAGFDAVCRDDDDGSFGEAMHVGNGCIDRGDRAEEGEPCGFTLGVFIDEDADEVTFFQCVFDIKENTTVPDNALASAGANLFEERVEMLVAKGVDNGFEGMAEHRSVDAVHLKVSDVPGRDDDTFSFVVNFLKALGIFSGDGSSEVVAVKKRDACVIDEQPGEVLHDFECHVSYVRFGEVRAKGVSEVPPHTGPIRSGEAITNDNEGSDKERDDGAESIADKFRDEPDPPESESEEESYRAVVEIFHRVNRIKGECPEFIRLRAVPWISYVKWTVDVLSGSQSQKEIGSQDVSV